MTKFAPAFDKAKAISLPKPVPAPVIKIVFPVNFNFSKTIDPPKNNFAIHFYDL